MTQIYAIEIDKIVGKGRPRFAKRGAFVTAYTPETTKKFESSVRAKIKDIMKEKQYSKIPAEKPVAVTIHLTFHLPKSFTKKEKYEKSGEPVTGRPDVDNIAKSILDAMNDVVFADDSQVYDLYITKHYKWRSEKEGDNGKDEIYLTVKER